MPAEGSTSTYWGTLPWYSSSSSSMTLYEYVIVGYPKSAMPADGQRTAITNSIKATVTPLDEVDDATENTASSTDYLYDLNISRMPYETLSASKYVTKDGSSTSSHTSRGNLEAYQLLNDTNAIFDWRIEPYARGYRLTHDGSDEFGPDNYGVTPYSFEVYDDFLSIKVGNTYYRLEPGDYEFDRVYLSSETIYSWNFETEQSTNHYRTASDGAYTVSYRIGNGAWTQADSSITAAGISNGVTLPEGVTAIKLVREGTDYAYSPNIYTTVTVLPTDHVKQILNNAKASGEENVRFTNLATLALKDSDGASRGNYDGRRPDNMPTDMVDANDQALGEADGATWYHANAYLQAPLDIDRTVTSVKSVSSSANTTAQSTRLSYTVRLATPLTVTTDSKEFAEELQELYNSSLDNTVFYDLLPEGAYLDTSTIRATYYLYSSTNSYGSSHKGDFEYEVIDNYKGTNRQLLKVTVTQPESEADRLVRQNGNRYLAGWGVHLNYSADYPWSNALLYGTRPENVCVATVDGPSLGSGNDESAVQEGLPNATLDDVDIAALAGVDGKGAPSSESSSDYYYSSVKDTVTFTYAEMAGLNKGIKASVKPSFTSSSSEVPEGHYTYEIRYTPEDGTAAKNLVFYDVLENAYGENPHWQANADGGTFIGVSAAQAVKAGVDAKVYYSTQVVDPQTDTLDANPGVWTAMTHNSDGSFSLPSGVDPSTVKSLAFDYRKATDGTDYVLGAGGTNANLSPATLTALIYMQAPDMESCIANELLPVDGRVPENYPIYAYNNGVISMQIAGDPASPFDATSFRTTNTTALRLCDPFIKLEKLVNDVEEYELGSQDETVEFTITGRIPVQANNDAGQINYNDLTYSDGLPRGMLLDTSSFKVKFAVLDEEGVEDESKTISFGFSDSDGDGLSDEGTEYGQLAVYDGTSEALGYLHSGFELSIPAEVARRFESRIMTVSFKARLAPDMSFEQYRGEDGKIRLTNTAEGSIRNSSKFNGEASADLIVPDRKLTAPVKQVKLNDGAFSSSQSIPGANDVVTYRVSVEVPSDGSAWKLTDALVDELELVDPDKATITLSGSLLNLSYADSEAFEEQYRNSDMSYTEYYELYYAQFKESSVSRTFSPAEWNALNSFYTRYTNTNDETGESTAGFSADFSSTGFTVEMNNDVKNLMSGIDYRDLWALFYGSFENQTNEETGEQSLVFTTPRGSMSSYRDDETGEYVYDYLYPYVSEKSSITGMTMTVEFKAKLKEGASLSKYIQADGSVVIPNTAVSDVPTATGATSSSNVATLIGKLPIVKRVQGANSATLAPGDSTADYTIEVEIPAYAEKAVITDQLDPALSLAGGASKLSVTDEAGAAVTADTSYASRLITVTLGKEALSKRTGTKVTISFTANVDLAADLSAYAGGTIPNTASVSIDDGPAITSNVVNVAPTPTSLAIVKTVNGADKLKLDSKDETFTYAVRAFIPEDAQSFSLIDTLDDVLVFASTADTVTLLDAQGAPVDDATVTIEDQTLSITLDGDPLVALRGSWVSVEFIARIADGADLSAYPDAAVPNTASYTVDGVTMSSNTVTVSYEEPKQPEPAPKSRIVPRTYDDTSVTPIAVAAGVGAAVLGAAYVLRKKDILSSDE